MGKYPNIFFKKHKLLQQRTKFWSVEKFSGDIRKECDEILTTTTKFVRYFIVITFLVVMNFFLQPILTGDLPVRVYVPKGWFHYINLTYWYLIPIIIGSTYGSDLIFCSVCIPIVVQFKLLAHKFENLTIENKAGFEKEVKKIVDHQNFLME